MDIKLPPEQERWLEARVAEGEFDSPEAAIRQIIAERMGREVDSLGWAKPYVDEPHATIARGDVLSVEEAIADVDAHIASLKR